MARRGMALVAQVFIAPTNIGHDPRNSVVKHELWNRDVTAFPVHEATHQAEKAGSSAQAADKSIAIPEINHEIGAKETRSTAIFVVIFPRNQRAHFFPSNTPNATDNA